MKPKKKKGKYSLNILLAVLIVFLDWYFQEFFRKQGVGFFNSGVSFGLGGEWGRVWQFLLPAFFGILLIFWANKKTRINIYLICLAIGGLGNILPRIVYGSVWDYIRLPLGLWVNMSDVLITLSVVSYILVP